MKRLVLVLCLLLVAGCFEQQSVWLYGNPESDGMIGGRLGTTFVKNLEVGAAVEFQPYDDTDSAEYGAYTLLHIPIGDINPYIGAQVPAGNGTWDIVDDIEPVGGISVGSVFAEWQGKSLHEERDKILFGLRFRF